MKDRLSQSHPPWCRWRPAVPGCTTRGQLFWLHSVNELSLFRFCPTIMFYSNSLLVVSCSYCVNLTDKTWQDETHNSISNRFQYVWSLINYWDQKKGKLCPGLKWTWYSFSLLQMNLQGRFIADPMTVAMDWATGHIPSNSLSSGRPSTSKGTIRKLWS